MTDSLQHHARGGVAPHRPWTLLFAVIVAGYAVSSARDVTVTDIAKNPAAFDQKPVSVSGIANGVDKRVSRKGNPYTTFFLVDGEQSVKVFSFGTLPVSAGERVEVRGTFQRVKHVGQYTFYDEIDATSVTRAR